MASLWVFGCRPKPTPPYEKWATPAEVRTNSPGGFASLVGAAKDCENRAGDYVHRVSFTPKMKVIIVDRLKPTIQILQRESGQKCNFEFEPLSPFLVSPLPSDWRLLGRALVWRIESEVKQEEYDAAIRDFGTALWFGYSLIGGDASTASLGVTIANEARAAIAPCLVRLSAGQLGRLEKLGSQGLESAPGIDVPIRNEGKNMRLAVQYVQDCYQRKDYKELEEKLGSTVKDAVSYLKKMQDHDVELRPTYFGNFAAEADGEVEMLLQRVQTPYDKRSKYTEPKGDRPYRRFVPHFFYSARPMIEMIEMSWTRTKLLLIDALLMKAVREDGKAPANLGSLPRDLIFDSYSNTDFVYRAAGAESKLYSIGEDLRDNGGDGGETGASPDILPESRTLH